MALAALSPDRNSASSFCAGRVLVVDDEPLIRWSIAEILSRHGYSTVGVGTVAHAIEAVTKSDEPIDVVILDCRLPDGRGLDTLTRVRGSLPAAAVVVITAEATPELVQEALDLGAVCVLAKPFDMDDVPRVVQHVARRRAPVAARAPTAVHHE